MLCVKCNKDKKVIFGNNICSTCYYENTNVNTICSDCKKQIQIYNIPKNICRKCYMDKFNKNNYEKNKEQIKQQVKKYYYNNKEKCLDGMKEYADKHKEELKEYFKNYFQKNKSRMQKDMKEYQLKNRKQIQEKAQKRRRWLYKNDINHKLRVVLRSRVGMAFKLNLKKGSGIKLIGCSINELKEYLEKQFKPEMNWQNLGFKGWHIDHIIPINKFNLNISEEVKKCFHYSNLQPLWWYENLSKGGK